MFLYRAGINSTTCTGINSNYYRYKTTCTGIKPHIPALTGLIQQHVPVFTLCKHTCVWAIYYYIYSRSVSTSSPAGLTQLHVPAMMTIKAPQG